MKIDDISLTLSETLPVWPGDRRTHIERKMTLEGGDMANVTYIKMGAHTGTHVDAPCHFLKGGSCVASLPLEILVGEAVVIEIFGESVLTKAAFQKVSIPEGTKRLLIKTKNSEHWAQGATEFDENYIALDKSGAEYIAQRGILLVGVDALSVASFHDLVATHEVLLKKDVVIVEGLNLANVEEGNYTLYCLPLKIAHSDGGPARAILVE